MVAEADGIDPQLRKRVQLFWLGDTVLVPGLVIIGAGTLSRAGGAVSDDWDFFDAWQVYGKRSVARGVGEGPPPRLIGEAILIERSEAASGLLYWNGSRLRWYQQGD